MDKAELHRQGTALAAFCEDFRDCAGTPTRRLIETYLRGQLGSLPRKSVLPIARDQGVAVRTLQELLSLHRWDEEKMRDRIQARIPKSCRVPLRTAAIVETHCVKKGVWTPGVDRQVIAASGRSRNAVVLVHLVAADAGFFALLDSGIYLPPRWVQDPACRERGGIPAGAVLRPRSEIALELLGTARRNGLSFDWLFFPPEYGEDPGWLERLTAQGQRFVTESASRAPGGLRRIVYDEGPPLLTNAPPPVGPAELAERLCERPRLERTFDAVRKDVGLEHFEVRKYRSLRRHLVLSSASALFLAERQSRAREEFLRQARTSEVSRLAR